MSDIATSPSDFDAKHASANPGDRLICASGQYRKNFFRLRNGVEIRSATRWGAEFISDGSNTIFQQPGGQTNKLSECRTNGAILDPQGRSRFDMSWNQCVGFSRGSNPGAGQGIRSGTHGGGWICDGSIIEDNDFDDVSGWAIGAYLLINTIIRRNRGHCANFLKADAFQQFHLNTIVEQNLWEGISRMCGEIQGRSKGLKWRDNYTRGQILPGGSDFSRNTSCLGASLITHGEDNRDNEFVRNVVEGIRPENRQNNWDNTGPRLALESGSGWLAEFNLIGVLDGQIGTFNSTFMGDSSGPKPEAVIFETFIRNNRIPGCKYGQGGSYGQYPSRAHYSNNGPNVELPWKLSRGIPGPGRDITAGTTFPPPDPVPPPVDPNAPKLAVAGISETEATFTWQNVDAAKPLRLDIRATGNGQATGDEDPGFPWHKVNIPAGATSAIVTDLPPLWELQARLSDGAKTTQILKWSMKGTTGGSELNPRLKTDTPTPEPTPQPGSTTSNHTLQRLLTDDELSSLIRLRFANKPASIEVKVKVTASGERSVMVGE